MRAGGALTPRFKLQKGPVQGAHLHLPRAPRARRRPSRRSGGKVAVEWELRNKQDKWRKLAGGLKPANKAFTFKAKLKHAGQLARPGRPTRATRISSPRSRRAGRPGPVRPGAGGPETPRQPADTRAQRSAGGWVAGRMPRSPRPLLTVLATGAARVALPAGAPQASRCAVRVGATGAVASAFDDHESGACTSSARATSSCGTRRTTPPRSSRPTRSSRPRARPRRRAPAFATGATPRAPRGSVRPRVQGEGPRAHRRGCAMGVRAFGLWTRRTTAPSRPTAARRRGRLLRLAVADARRPRQVRLARDVPVPRRRARPPRRALEVPAGATRSCIKRLDGSLRPTYRNRGRFFGLNNCSDTNRRSAGGPSTSSAARGTTSTTRWSGSRRPAGSSGSAARATSPVARRAPRASTRRPPHRQRRRLDVPADQAIPHRHRPALHLRVARRGLLDALRHRPRAPGRLAPPRLVRVCRRLRASKILKPSPDPRGSAGPCAWLRGYRLEPSRGRPCRPARELRSPPMRLIVARCEVRYTGRLDAPCCPRRCG